jgi:hypothetical protein
MLAWGVIAIAFAVYGVLLARHVGAYAGGADSSGYLNHARMLANGNIRIAPRIPDEFRPLNLSPWIYAALGFRPSVDAASLVPTYPAGFPLLLLLASYVVGWTQAGAVTMWVHGMLGVVLTYVAGRMFGLAKGSSLLAATIVAASPLYLFMSLTLMSDVPAMVWITAAVLTAWQSRKRATWALAAGLIFAGAVLMRPSNLLAIAPIAFALGGSWRGWAWWFLGGLPGACFQFAHAHAAYGNIFANGYGDGAQVDATWILPTLLHYARWLPILFTPIVAAFFALPFVSRAHRREAWLLGSWVIVFAAFYATYEFTHFTWWFLRYLLPAAPALVIGALLALQARVTPRFPAVAGMIALIITVAALLRFDSYWSEKLSALDSGKNERVYPIACAWANEHLPEDATIVAMQVTGALVYYTRFSFLHWERLSAADFSRVADALTASHRPLYAMMFPHEITEMHAFANNLAKGSWTKVATIENVTVWRWSATAPPP